MASRKLRSRKPLRYFRVDQRKHVERCIKWSALTAYLRADFILVTPPIVIILSFAQQIILIVALAILSWRNRLDPELCENLWRNTRERMQIKEKEQAEESSYLKCIEVVLRETARKSYPENVDNPMMTPSDYEVRQSGRVMELQNTDLWI